MASCVLAVDQGTTSTRAIVFRADTSIAALAQREFPQHFPADGEVEHEPEDLWLSTFATCHEALGKAGAAARDVAKAKAWLDAAKREKTPLAEADERDARNRAMRAAPNNKVEQERLFREFLKQRANQRE